MSGFYTVVLVSLARSMVLMLLYRSVSLSVFMNVSVCLSLCFVCQLGD